jgi:predicted DCC family thiol-disulfide oxidoreductase YuxK
MNMLKDHTILYDGQCPMCNIYTKAFVNAGMLEDKGRISYQEQNSYATVDMQRAVNEIALVNNKTGEVMYGIKSIFYVLGNAFPFFKPLFYFGPFVWLMSKLYSFISYNRRVIVPPTDPDAQFIIQPTFKLHYRLLYLLFTGFVTAFVLSCYAGLLVPLLPAGNEYREYIVCFGQMFFQGIIVSIFFKNKLWGYIGNMMTVSFAGALALLPALLISIWVKLTPAFYLAYFLIIVFLMLLEHIRRCKLLAIGRTMTITWILYRIIVLFIIFKLSGDAIC